MNISKTKMPPAATGGFFFRSNRRKYNPVKSSFQGLNNKELRLKKYTDALLVLPQRGGGLHAALMGVANLGVLAGLSGQQLYDDIKVSGRAFRRGEIEEAINKAHKGMQKKSSYGASFIPPYKTAGERLRELLQTEQRAKELQERLIIKGGDSIDPFGDNLREASSPSPEIFECIEGIDGSEHCSDMLLFLRELYHPDDYLYIGTGFEKTWKQFANVKTVKEWLEFFTEKINYIKSYHDEFQQCCIIQDLANTYPFFTPNPLTGNSNQCGSYRSDSNVAKFRYIIVESDILPIEKQIPLLIGLRLPVVSLVFTGNKSIHALLDATVINNGQAIRNAEEWDRVVKLNLFGQLAPLGFDRATCNSGHLSRFPGILRLDRNKFHELLYIDKEGGALCLNQ